jgi:hypothetical protein
MQRVLGSRGAVLVFLLVALVYVGLRLAAFLPSSTRTFPDSGDYLHVASQPLLSGEFWAGWRGWTVPLLYKLLPDSDAIRSAAQLALSIACWVALATVAGWCVRRRELRPVAFCLVLLFSLSVWITQWDRLILSHSLSISLAAAVFAAWLGFVRAPGRWTIVAVLGTTLLWSFARDTDAYVAVFTVPFVLGWAMFRDPRGPCLLLALGLTAIFVAHAVSVSASTDARRVKPLLNVIGSRVLTDEGELRYFQDHGMPVPARLRDLAGNLLGRSQLERELEDPRLDPFLEWVRARGQRTLVTYLLTHPDHALDPAFRHPEPLFAADPPPAPHANPIATYRAKGTDPLLPAPLADVVYPPSVPPLLAWLGVVVAAAAWLVWRGASRAVWLVPAIALLLQIPHAAVVWHGDTNELPRHALQVGVMTRLSLLLLTIFLIDAALGLRDRAVPESDRARPSD